MTACADQETPTEIRNLPTRPLHNELEPEWSDGNEYMFSIAQSDPSYPYNPAYPTWNGQTSPFAGWAFECPPVWAGITRFYHNGTQKWYQPGLGLWYKVMDGTCTLGWDIWLDDAPVCKGGVHV